MNYWITTEAGYRIGPYDTYANAWYSAVENFGFEGWVISSTGDIRGEA